MTGKVQHQDQPVWKRAEESLVDLPRYLYGTIPRFCLCELLGGRSAISQLETRRQIVSPPQHLGGTVVALVRCVTFR